MPDDEADDQDTENDEDSAQDASIPGVATTQAKATGGALTFKDLPEPDYAGLYAIEDLSVDGDNPNEMSDKVFGLLVDRMRQHGWLGGPIITDTGGTIADGEHRWRAAKEIGLQEVPVRMYDIDEPTRRLWREELNKIHGEHDKQRDALEYDYLIEQGKKDEVVELADARGEDLDELLASLRVNRDTPIQYDYGGEPNVHYMDCVEGMKTHLDDDSVDLVFTSPPYNVDLGGGKNPDKKLRGAVAYNDDMDPSEYHEFIGDVLDQLARVTKPTGHIFFNIHNDGRNGHITPPWFVAQRMPDPWRLGSFVVWSKQNTSRMSIKYGENGRFSQTWEPVFHFINEPNPLRGRRNFDVWNVRQSSDERDHDTGPHPAPYSVELVKEAIEPCTPEGALVLDPFLGSGTTAVAAIEMERDYVGFELDQDDAYKPIIERRIRDAHRRMDTANTREEAAQMREEDEADAEVEADD